VRLIHLIYALLIQHSDLNDIGPISPAEVRKSTIFGLANAEDEWLSIRTSRAVKNPYAMIVSISYPNIQLLKGTGADLSICRRKRANCYPNLEYDLSLRVHQACLAGASVVQGIMIHWRVLIS